MERDEKDGDASSSDGRNQVAVGGWRGWERDGTPNAQLPTTNAQEANTNFEL